MSITIDSSAGQAVIEWAENNWQFKVGAADFWTPLEAGASRNDADGMQVFKTRALIEQYMAVFAEDQPKTVMELGIHQGGSTALLGMVGGFDRIVSIELNEERLPDLDAFVAEHGLEDMVNANFGVDQADPPRLHQIIDEGFGDQPLDLVIDDASHALAPTRVSFDTIFPRLRPGGLYIIEDWAGSHLLAGAARRKADEKKQKKRKLARPAVAKAMRLANAAPLSIMATELSLAMIESPDMITSINIDPHWISVRKSPNAPPAKADPDFRLGNLYHDDFELVAVPAPE